LHIIKTPEANMYEERPNFYTYLTINRSAKIVFFLLTA